MSRVIDRKRPFKRRYVAAPTPPTPLPPMLRSALPTDADQSLLRERRRSYQPFVLGSTYVNHHEVRDVCTAVAVGTSQLPRPLVMCGDVADIADAVHELQVVTVGLIATDRHLAVDQRARTVQAAADLAVRPALPDITDQMIVSGSWLDVLVAYVEPYSADLADLLGRALPPDAPELRGGPSVSERVVKALRELDHGVLVAQRRLARVADRQRLPSVADYNQAQRDRLDAERRDRAMAKLTRATR
ncbi:hypothetical protein ACNUDN_11820 [Mycobacterium sp. smrl_JER01]|uniref:hypothetical protein n=1 Tax=Mycobacterium sp. smrl_JER01 TaxID=3402633 RepID=UPI003AC46750